jgi:hypothetical protein
MLSVAHHGFDIGIAQSDRLLCFFVKSFTRCWAGGLGANPVSLQSTLEDQFLS